MQIGRFALTRDSGDRNQDQVASRIPWSLLGVGFVALALYSVWTFQQHNWEALATGLILCLGLPVMLLWRWTRRNTRAQLIVLLCYVSGTVRLVAGNGTDSSLLLVAVVLSGALLTRRAALLWCATIIATVFAGISPYGLWVFHAVEPPESGVWWWLSSASGFTAIALLFYLSQQYALSRCVQSLEERFAVGLGIGADEPMAVEEALQREARLYGCRLGQCPRSPLPV